MKNFRWTILAALLVSTSGVAHAQDVRATTPPPGSSSSSMPSSSMSSSSMSSSSSSSTPGATGGTVNGMSQDSGSITNAFNDENTTLAGTSGASPGIGADGSSTSSSTSTTTTTTTTTTENVGVASTLVDTGGEPMLVSLVGLTIAASALLVRRRVTG